MLSIGLMSGTSMDGIEAALLNTDGIAQIEEIADVSLPYDAEFKLLLKSAEYAVRKSQGNIIEATKYYSEFLYQYLNVELALAPNKINEKLAALSYYLAGNQQPITFDQIVKRSTLLHAKVVKMLLKKAPGKMEIIGYHGQTLFHSPFQKITLQIGDGEFLANELNIPVINNFRRQDIIAGGQGAPFAPLYHQALAIRDNCYPLAVVNCGGIANVTLITGKTEQDVIGFDTGPGNGLIDQYVRFVTQGQEHMDENGQYGINGEINSAILNQLYQHAVVTADGNFFQKLPPKSLDIGDLKLIPELYTLSRLDACATLEAFTADSIVTSVKLLSRPFPSCWILAGGGWKNPVIKRELIHRLQQAAGNPVKIITAEEAGWNGRALEAQIFAYLAVRRFKGLPISLPAITGVPYPLTGGDLFLPEKKI